MTDPTAPVSPQQPTPDATGSHEPPQVPPPTSPAVMPPGGTLPGAATPPTGRSNAKAWLIGGIALVIALCCGGIGIAAFSDGNSEEPTAAAGSPTSASPTTATPTTAAPTTAAPTTAAPTSAAPTYATPTKKDFKLAVKVLRKQCFGSAGCHITYRVNVTYTGSDLDPYTTYELTYEVKGAEDPIINTLEVTGDSASVQDEEMASTKRSSDKLTAVVTDINEL
ncbi:hypothetical protein [Micromonospora sp. NPDC049799]|uniref:hypothetical protein n=1 Tax=Micromonospora sp. NPDC049799 TaxID=3154741 RepID=UPI0033F52772